MLTFTTRVRVDDLTGAETFDFLAAPDDESCSAWWPGTHLEFHAVARGDDPVGDFSRAFADDLDAHARPEFALLRDLLRPRRPPSDASTDVQASAR